MSNTTPPPEQGSSISAAELRRRLLASTPPPIAATASTPEADTATATTEQPPTEDGQPAPPPGSAQELLARLRMPGKSGPIPVTTPRPAPSVPIATDPAPTRPAVNRRHPPPAGGRLDPTSAINGALSQLAGMQDSGRYVDDSPIAEVSRLKSENKELRKLLEEMKHLLQEASDTEQQKDKAYTEALTAKDAQIEELSTQLGAIEEQIAKGELVPPPPVAKTRTELEEWGDELEKENAQLQQARKKIEEERRQLREDEEALEAQMREMEVAMARERALIARQETELRRLSAEIQHELEIMQRGDASLREQMAKFQRRAAEVLSKPPGAGGNNGRR